MTVTKNPIAYLTLSNCGGIAIYEIDYSGDVVIYTYYDEEPREAAIIYGIDEETEDGTTGFYIGESFYSFSDFLRTNIF